MISPLLFRTFETRVSPKVSTRKQEGEARYCDIASRKVCGPTSITNVRCACLPHVTTSASRCLHLHYTTGLTHNHRQPPTRSS
uniref:Uncharacterized protein n=1 Tax=Oryza sativa subsp. japonica TaxID=39947 RepID=Q6ESE9_ORYSJ|nr:hypothetical protein [Oryza sativa Japonica Group]